MLRVCVPMPCSTLGKHEDVWSRVYDDRLGVFSYHKPGEPPATRLADVEDVASALAPTPRLWDPQAPPERPALRQSSLGGVVSTHELAAWYHT